MSVKHANGYASSVLQKAVFPWSAWAYTIDHRGIRDKEPSDLCAIEPSNDTPVWIAKDPDLA